MKKLTKWLKAITMENLIYGGAVGGFLCYLILAITGYDIFDVLEYVFGNNAAQITYWVFVAMCGISGVFVLYVVIRGIINAEKELRDD
jgi:hypothetical protein